MHSSSKIKATSWLMFAYSGSVFILTLSSYYIAPTFHDRVYDFLAWSYAWTFPLTLLGSFLSLVYMKLEKPSSARELLIYVSFLYIGEALGGLWLLYSSTTFDHIQSDLALRGATGVVTSLVICALIYWACKDSIKEE